jgi:hypothetical protein
MSAINQLLTSWRDDLHLWSSFLFTGVSKAPPPLLSVLLQTVQRLDLFRQILDPRSAGRAFLGIARIEPLQIIF